MSWSVKSKQKKLVENIPKCKINWYTKKLLYFQGVANFCVIMSYHMRFTLAFECQEIESYDAEFDRRKCWKKIVDKSIIFYLHRRLANTRVQGVVAKSWVSHGLSANFHVYCLECSHTLLSKSESLLFSVLTVFFSKSICHTCSVVDTHCLTDIAISLSHH